MTSTADDSVTQWVGRLRAGEPAAARHLWDRYFARMVQLARARLKGVPRQAADEEDVALSAFKSFCRAVGDGRCDRPPDGGSLWTLLMTLTARKAVDLLRHEAAQKRRPPSTGQPPPPLDEVLGREPEPEFAARMAEECQRLLDALGDPVLRAIALRKMEGFGNAEVAAELGLGLRSVERKLRLIRLTWEEEAGR